jgi:hypothetical protein
MVAHLRVGRNGMLTVALKRNLLARRRHFSFCSETQSWCVIKQNSQHFVRPNPEMRDHTQGNQKSFGKKSVFEKFSLLELSGGQNVFCNYLTQES